MNFSKKRISRRKRSEMIQDFLYSSVYVLPFILTDKEIMGLSIRLAVVRELAKGKTQTEIIKELKVSSCTIVEVRKRHRDLINNIRNGLA